MDKNIDPPGIGGFGTQPLETSIENPVNL